jgi:hypothetical protein
LWRSRSPPESTAFAMSLLYLSSLILVSSIGRIQQTFKFPNLVPHSNMSCNTLNVCSLMPVLRLFFHT